MHTLIYEFVNRFIFIIHIEFSFTQQYKNHTQITDSRSFTSTYKQEKISKENEREL